VNLSIKNITYHCLEAEFFYKEAFMKKAFLFGMAALLLASSLSIVSCGDVGSSNAFVGTWVSTNFMLNTLGNSATLKFTNSDWTLTVPSLGVNEKGNYKIIADNTAQLLQNNSIFAGASNLNGPLLLSIYAQGPLYGAGGQFTKQQ